jgi:hypothetical protein
MKLFNKILGKSSNSKQQQQQQQQQRQQEARNVQLKPIDIQDAHPDDISVVSFELDPDRNLISPENSLNSSNVSYNNNQNNHNSNAQKRVSFKVSPVAEQKEEEKEEESMDALAPKNAPASPLARNSPVTLLHDDNTAHLNYHNRSTPLRTASQSSNRLSNEFTAGSPRNSLSTASTLSTGTAGRSSIPSHPSGIQQYPPIPPGALPDLSSIPAHVSPLDYNESPLLEGEMLELDRLLVNGYEFQDALRVLNFYRYTRYTQHLQALQARQSMHSSSTQAMSMYSMPTNAGPVMIPVPVPVPMQATPGLAAASTSQYGSFYGSLASSASTSFYSPGPMHSPAAIPAPAVVDEQLELAIQQSLREEEERRRRLQNNGNHGEESQALKEAVERANERALHIALQRSFEEHEASQAASAAATTTRSAPNPINPYACGAVFTADGMLENPMRVNERYQPAVRTPRMARRLNGDLKAVMYDNPLRGNVSIQCSLI